MFLYSGVLGIEEPHHFIPNLVVKLCCNDDTVGKVLQKISRCHNDKNPNTSRSYYFFDMKTKKMKD